MTNTHEHLEHAEHSEHASHSGGLVATIAISMAVIAALLAIVTMLSHRSHNEHIIKTAEAARLSIDANILHTKASDTWAFYQAKKIRDSEYRAYLELLPLMAREPEGEAAQKLRKTWTAQVEKYEGDGKDELKATQTKAEDLTKQAEEKQAEARAIIGECELVHERSNRFDLAELAVEIGLVLCSIAMLAKKKLFWAIAIVFALGGTGVAYTGYASIGIAHGAHAAEGHVPEGHAAEGHAAEAAPEKKPEPGEHH